jgi:hypothetical protein
MADLAWYWESPSVYTIVFFVVCIFFVARILYSQSFYPTQKRRRLGSFVDGFFILGLVVTLTDMMWCAASGLRFGSMFPDSQFNIMMSFFRDVIGFVLCFYLLKPYFKSGLLKFNSQVKILIVSNAVFLSTWFITASSPAQTDFTFAIINNYPLDVVLRSFFISHFLGRIIVVLMLFSLIVNKGKHEVM